MFKGNLIRTVNAKVLSNMTTSINARWTNKVTSVVSKRIQRSSMKSKEVDSAINYSKYNMGHIEYIKYVLLAISAVFITGYIFYQNALISLSLCPLAFIYPIIKREQIVEKRKQELRLQFKDMLYYLSTALSVGKSIESAFKDALLALRGVYIEDKIFIILELESILSKIGLNQSIEEVLFDFAIRSGIDDIKSFAEVYSTCNRKGGNVIDIIGSTATVIKEKIEIEQEIQNIITAKRLEKNILIVMPITLVLILSVSGGGYLDVLYDTAQGRLVMTCAILMMGLGYLISKKIMDIRV